MIKRLFKFLSIGFLSVLLSFTLHVDLSNAEMAFSEDEAEMLLSTPIEPSQVNQTSEKKGLNKDLPMDEAKMKELFGDDQVFPFAAGLDSY